MDEQRFTTYRLCHHCDTLELAENGVRRNLGWFFGFPKRIPMKGSNCGNPAAAGKIQH